MAKVSVPQWLWIALIIWGIISFITIIALSSDIEDTFTCEDGSIAYCFDENGEEPIQCEDGAKAYCFDKTGEQPIQCEDGYTSYCFRDDYNVGSCLNDERVYCE